MRCVIGSLLSLALAITLIKCLPVSILWSPDGRWLAYTQAVRPLEQVLSPGWIFDSGSESAAETEQAPAEGLFYRIWATQADGSESVRLEESPGPLTAPGWNPKGTALAFGRLVSGEEGRGRFEIVVQESPDHQRVLKSWPVTDTQAAAGLPELSVSWGPDGRHLIVPQIQPRGLAILRADDGRLIKSLEDAYRPSWSPDGSRIVYFRGGDPGGLYGFDAPLGEPRLLAQVAQPVQAPTWTPDGQAVLVLVRKAPGALPVAPMGRGPLARPVGPEETPMLVKIRADTGQIESARNLAHEPIRPEQTFLGASCGVNRDGEELFYTTSVEGQSSQISWMRVPRGMSLTNGVILKRFHPLDFAIPIGGLTVSPTNLVLAFRAGPPGLLSPPAVCDPASGNVTLFVPDDEARAEWLVTLIGAARSLLREHFPAPEIQGRVIERPTLLPAPGEEGQVSGEVISIRLRRLADLGLPLCDRPTGDPPAPQSLAILMDEARLFFRYLQGNYPAALDALETVENRVGDPEQRLRLLGLRAQIYLGLADGERARGTIAYLRSLQPKRRRPVESTPLGPVLGPETEPGGAWASYLEGRAEALLKPTPVGGSPSELPPLPTGPPAAGPIPGAGVNIQIRPAPPPIPPQVRQQVLKGEGLPQNPRAVAGQVELKVQIIPPRNRVGENPPQVLPVVPDR